MPAEASAQKPQNNTERQLHPRVSFGASRALPDHIVARRTGNVLIKHTILKSDHFPGIVTNEPTYADAIRQS